MAKGERFYMEKHSSMFTNILLTLILVGIVVIILLMLFWFPSYWGYGAAVVGEDGRVLETGGRVVINAACCDGGTRDCPTPGNGDKPVCGSDGRIYRSEAEARRAGVQVVPMEECKEDTCEDRCYEAYPYGTLAQSQCVDACAPGDPCEEKCAQRYTTGTTAYMTCVQTECREPGDPCEERCGHYGQGSSMYDSCMYECRNPGQTTTTSEPDCRDSDGNNLEMPGKLVYGDQTFVDHCYSATEVVEYTCRDGQPHERREVCEGRCSDGRCVVYQDEKYETTPTHYS